MPRTKTAEATKATDAAVKPVEQNTTEPKTFLLTPRATEKTYTEQTKHTYVFVVPLNFTKQQIINSVSDQFDVTVTDVRVLTRKGKATRFSRGKHAYPGTTHRRDHKLAYVTVGAEDSILIAEFKDLDEAAEDSNKSASTSKTSDKAAEKSAKTKGAK